MDPWLNEFERLNQQASEINADIKDVTTRISAGGAAHAKASASARRKLVDFTNDIASLNDMLPKLQITEKERQRRRDMVLSLSTRKDQLADSLTRSSNPAISQLQQSPDPGKKRTWGAQPQETDETRALDNAGLVVHQKTVMQQQDEHIDILSSSIFRQKEIATTIHTELDVHSRLLDDLESKTDKTTYGIESTNKRVGRISQSAKVGGMWCVIIVLIILLIALLATNFGCDFYKFKNC